MERIWKDEYGVTYSYDKTILIRGNQELKEYTVRPETKIIGLRSWANMNNLRSISLPEGLETIEDAAFDNCTSLERADIPASVKTIGVAAFCRTAITHVVIPVGVEEIPDQAFAMCINMEWVTLQKGLKTIRKNAFMACYRAKFFFIAKQESMFPELIEDDAFPCTGCRFLVYEGMASHFVRNYPVQRNQIFRLVLSEGEKEGRIYDMDAVFAGSIRFRR